MEKKLNDTRIQTMKIQSVSDVITNSSSEIFLIITIDDKELAKEVYKFLFEALDNDEYKDSDMYLKACDWDLDENPPVVMMTAPYGFTQTNFVEKCVKTILENHFPDKIDKMKIEHYDDY